MLISPQGDRPLFCKCILPPTSAAFLQNTDTDPCTKGSDIRHPLTSGLSSLPPPGLRRGRATLGHFQFLLCDVLTWHCVGTCKLAPEKAFSPRCLPSGSQFQAPCQRRPQRDLRAGVCRHRRPSLAPPEHLPQGESQVHTASPASVCSPEGLAGLGVQELAATASSQVLTHYYEPGHKPTDSHSTAPAAVPSRGRRDHGDDHGLSCLQGLRITPVSLLTAAVPGGKGDSSDHRGQAVFEGSGSTSPGDTCPV